MNYVIPNRFVAKAIILALAWLAFCAMSANADVVLFDGMFANSDWSQTVFYDNGGGSGSALQQASGGHPGSYRQNNISVNALYGYNTIVFVFNEYLPQSYTPSTAGAIASIDYSQDTMALSGSGPQATAPALFQNGEVFVVDGGAAVDTGGSTWTTFALSGLTQNSFEKLDFSQTGTNPSIVDPSIHPDFSATGSSIYFGYVDGNSTPSDGGSYSTSMGMDNWSTIVNPVPEPTAYVILGPIFMFLLIRGLRRHAMV